MPVLDGIQGYLKLKDMWLNPDTTTSSPPDEWSAKSWECIVQFSRPVFAAAPLLFWWCAPISWSFLTSCNYYSFQEHSVLFERLGCCNYCCASLWLYVSLVSLCLSISPSLPLRPLFHFLSLCVCMSLTFHRCLPLSHAVSRSLSSLSPSLSLSFAVSRTNEETT